MAVHTMMRRWSVMFLAGLMAISAACGEDSPGGGVTGEVDVDTEAPELGFLRPEEGTSISGLVDIEIEAMDEGGVAQVSLILDGEALANLPEAPYLFQWDTSQVAAGPHTLKAEATDEAGNKGEASITLFVESCALRGNCPEAGGLVFVRPGEGEVLTGVVEVEVEPEGEGAFESVTFTVGEAVVGAAAQAPYAIFWDTGGFDGEVALRATALDAAGAEASARLNVFVDNEPPVVDLAQPGLEDVVDAQVRYEARITDNSGRFEARLSVEGTEVIEIAQSDTERFEGALDVSGLGAGEYTLTATAVDRAGHSGADSRPFIVDRAPSVAFESPEVGARITGTVEVRVEAADDVALDRVELHVDGEHLGDFDGSGAFAWTPPQGQGPARLEALAFDSRGQQARAEIEVQVDRAFELRLEKCAGACTPLEPGDGLNGTVRLRALSDDAQLARVAFAVDGVEIGVATGAPFEVSFATLDFEDGEVVVSASAGSIDALEAGAQVRVRINNCDRDDDSVISRGGRCAGTDCDDLNPEAFPGADDEVGDGVDQNCDGLDGVDFDQDDHASLDSGGGDCDDEDPEVFPCPNDPIGVCADLFGDRLNCGGCNVVCDPSLSCLQGACGREGDRCEEGEPEDYDFDVPATFYNDLEIVTDRTQGEDIDGDGDVDNAFGPMLGDLGDLLGADVNAQLDFLIRTGQLNLGSTWPTLAPPDVAQSVEVEVDFFDLEDVDNNPNTRSAYRATRDSFVPGFRTPRTHFEGGTIADGLLSVGPADNFLMVIPFGSIPLQLIIDQATFRAEVSADNLGIRVSEGTLSGTISFENFILALNTYLQSDFCSCLGLDGPMIDLRNGNGPRACVGDFDNRTCEQRGQGLCGAIAENCALFMLVLPGQMDIDTDDNRRNDAFSVFIRLDGQGTDIQGVAP